MPNADDVLASAAAHSVVPGVNPRDVVVAIVGGTMLTLALTRPRLRWVERLTEDSESNRVWAERALTLFAFAMAGYAWTALYMVLHKQLGHRVDTLLQGAACFLIMYAWLTHFEPFVAEWRLGGGLRAGTLYTGVAVLAAGVGVVIAETLLSSAFTSSAAAILAIASGFAFITWLLYKAIPHLDAFVDGTGPKSPSDPPTEP
jgi:hypothetical protein